MLQATRECNAQGLCQVDAIGVNVAIQDLTPGVQDWRARHRAIRRAASAHSHRPRAAQALQGADLRRGDLKSRSADRRAPFADDQPAHGKGDDDFYYAPSAQGLAGG